MGWETLDWLVLKEAVSKAQPRPPVLGGDLGPGPLDVSRAEPVGLQALRPGLFRNVREPQQPGAPQVTRGEQEDVACVLGLQPPPSTPNCRLPWNLAFPSPHHPASGLLSLGGGVFFPPYAAFAGPGGGQGASLALHLRPVQDPALPVLSQPQATPLSLCDV